MQIEKHIRLIALSLGIALVILEIAMVNWLSEPSFTLATINYQTAVANEYRPLSVIDVTPASGVYADDCFVAALDTALLEL